MARVQNSRRRIYAGFTAAAAALALGPSAASADALRTSPCPGQAGFRCGSLTVPLDHAAPGGRALRLRVAVQGGGQTGKPPLIALTGGPGQPGVAYASSFAQGLRPLLRRYRLVTLDQRGTGSSGALRCGELQRLSDLAPISPAAVARCGTRLGPARRFYGTRDTVDDLDALRAALGAPQLALMGVSYGTFVAQQYARVHPDRVSALVLDSVVSPAGVDASFMRDTYAAVPRVLAEQCARRRCAGVTRHPLADLRAVVRRAEAGPLAAPAYDARGRSSLLRYGRPEELVNLLVSGDLNPFLQAALPAAFASAADGDLRPLLRLRAIGTGAAATASEISAGLFVATTCIDAPLPYALSAPPLEREAALDAALAQIPASAYVPFDRATVRSTASAEDCLRWPDDEVRRPSTAPLPDVPALLLTGRLDLRTPTENAQAVARELPRAAVVPVAGTGHDELDSDITGCVARAVSRFARGVDVGTPCAGRTNQVIVDPRAPRHVPRGPRAVVRAVLGTVSDARNTSYQRLFAGLGEDFGGLRGGRVSGRTLHRYTWAPGVHVSGRVRFGTDAPSGRVVVDGPGRLDGALRLTPSGRALGRLGGRRVGGRVARVARALGSAGGRAARRRDHREPRHP